MLERHLSGKGFFLNNKILHHGVVRAKVYLPGCEITGYNYPEPGRECGRVSAWVSV